MSFAAWSQDPSSQELDQDGKVVTQHQDKAKNKKPLDEIVIRGTRPYRTITVRAGWRPSSREEAEEHIQNTYSYVYHLDYLAKRCDPDGIVFYNDYKRLDHCEDFVQEVQNRSLVNHGFQCRGLMLWFSDMVQALQEDSNWRQKEQAELNWYVKTRADILASCDYRSIIKSHADLRTAFDRFELIYRFVAGSGIGGGFRPVR